MSASENIRKQPRGSMRALLYEEVFGQCPRCGKCLRNQKTHRMAFDEAHIYPLNPSPTEIGSLAGEEKMFEDGQVNSVDNFIAMCKNCHDEFDHPRTVPEYRYLISLKKKIRRRYEVGGLGGKFYLEERVKDIVEKLSRGVVGENMETLAYRASNVRQKMRADTDKAFVRHVENDVRDYFRFIQDELHTFERVDFGISERLSAQVQAYYKKIGVAGVSQPDVFEDVVRWVMLKTQSQDVDAARIVVSYFVQECEVFENVAQ